MHNAKIEEFELRLVERGCAPTHLRRLVRELADHHEDLRQAALEEGLSEPDAETRANQLLGEPADLAARLAVALRHSCWCGRHPILSFCLLPPVAIFAVTALALGLLYVFARLLLPAAQAAALADGGAGFQWIVLGVKMIYFSAITFAAVLFCWLARRSASGFGWALAACAICALYGLFGFVGIRPHSVFVGFVSIPFWYNWISAAIPLFVLVGSVAWHWLRKSELVRSQIHATTLLSSRTAGVLLAGVMAFALTGCASAQRKNPGETASAKQKPVHSRGWIGGDYRMARKQTFWRQISGGAGIENDASFPDVVTREQGSAIRLTALETNTPAELAGLRKGDLILELDHHVVNRLKDFRRRIDRCEPGTTLPAKVYRDGETKEFRIRVGRETFQREGTLAFTVPSFVRAWDLWPNPGFSLVFVGYEPNPGFRSELESRRTTSDEDWRAWLVIFQISTGKKILSQTNVPPATASQRRAVAGKLADAGL